MNITAYILAQRFGGTVEVAGQMANPQILAFLRADAEWPEDDAVPWCSGFVNYVCKLLGVPRSGSLRARSWLEVGIPITLDEARVGWDVVIFNRGGSPDPTIINEPGHVGFYAGEDEHGIIILGGNQSDTVKLSHYPKKDVLGVRLLREETA